VDARLTLPKLNTLGLTIKLTNAFSPLPASEMAPRVLLAFEEIVSVAGELPAAVGENVTVYDALLEVGMLMGRFGPENEYSLLESDSAEIFKAALPVFETVNVCVAFCPTTTD